MPRPVGLKLSDETKAKLSAMRVGTANPFFGRKHSAETRAKMSAARKGRLNNFYGQKHSDEARERMSRSHAGKRTGSANVNWGKPRDPEVLRKVSETRIRNKVAVGENNPNWRGGVTKSRKAVLSTSRYKQWRLAVFTRDLFKCQGCGTHGTRENQLQADHIKPWAYFPGLRYEADNGRTLCKKCHKTTYKSNQQYRYKMRTIQGNGYIAVDLDGTLAHYMEGQGVDIGEPVPDMLERVKLWLNDGIEVRIMTARACEPRNIPAVKDWLRKQGLPELEVTNAKDFNMIELWDDRAVEVIPNTGRPANPLRRLAGVDLPEAGSTP